MTIGSTSCANGYGASQAASSGNDVQAAVAVTMQKQTEKLDADITSQLIASATGVGQRLDVKG